MQLDPAAVSGINGALHESQVCGIRKAADGDGVELLIGVMAAVLPSGELDQEYRRLLRFRRTSRIRVWARAGIDAPVPGATMPLGGLDELERLFTEIDFGWPMYDRDFLDGDVVPLDPWPEVISLDVVDPAGSAAHSFYWWAECFRYDGSEPANFTIEGTITFGDLEILRGDSEALTAAEFAEQARHWWEEVFGRGNGPSGEAQPAQRTSTFWNPWRRSKASKPESVAETD